MNANHGVFCIVNKNSRMTGSCATDCVLIFCWWKHCWEWQVRMRVSKCRMSILHGSFKWINWYLRMSLVVVTKDSQVQLTLNDILPICFLRICHRFLTILAHQTLRLTANGKRLRRFGMSLHDPSPRANRCGSLTWNRQQKTICSKTMDLNAIANFAAQFKNFLYFYILWDKELLSTNNTQVAKKKKKKKIVETIDFQLFEHYGPSWTPFPKKKRLISTL